MPRARSAVAGVVCCEMRCEGCPSTGTARPSTATGSCIENPSRGRSCRQMRSNRFLSHFTSGRFLLYDAEFSAVCFGVGSRRRSAPQVSDLIDTEGVTRARLFTVYTISVPVSYTHLRAHETRHDI